MKKKTVILFLLTALLAAAAASTEGVSFEIRYYDRSIYYTDSPIYVKVEITNNSTETYRFKLADARPFSLDFSVKTLRHEELEHSEKYVMNRLTNRQIFFREIALEPGESYSFIEDLRDFIRIDEARQYRLQASFYPELTSQRQIPMTSNVLSLTVRPGNSGDEIMAYIEEATGNILAAEALPPDEVISYTIQARQKSQWEKFFLYLDLEALYTRTPINAERYRRASEEDRRSLLAGYRDQLRGESVEGDLLTIPHEFRILRTTYTQDSGKVDVLAKFHFSGFTELKQYTYTLGKDRGIWKITNYEVTNLGTE